MLVIVDDWSKFGPEEQSDKRIQSWNLDNFIKACSDMHSSLKWANVLKKLDCADLHFKDKKSLAFFLKFF